MPGLEEWEIFLLQHHLMPVLLILILGKVPFNTSDGGVNITYTPWLKKLVNDVYLASMQGIIN